MAGRAALAAGEDATRRLLKRVLSRAEARRKLQEAEVRIAALFDSERRGRAAEG